MALLFPDLAAQIPHQRYGHRPGLRVHLWIREGGLVLDGVEVDHRQPFDDMQRVAMKVASHVEPGLAIEIGRFDDERVTFPAATRIAHK